MSPSASAPATLKRVEGIEQLLYEVAVPKGHGHGRGNLLGIFVPNEAGGSEAVGYGYVVEAREDTLQLYANHLPEEHRDKVLTLGPLDPEEHLGRRLGRVVGEEDLGRFHIDLGDAHGVRVGERYRIYGEVLTDTSLEGRPLGRKPVGELKVVTVSPGGMASLAVLLEGEARTGPMTASGHPTAACGG